MRWFKRKKKKVVAKEVPKEEKSKDKTVLLKAGVFQFCHNCKKQTTLEEDVFCLVELETDEFYYLRYNLPRKCSCGFVARGTIYEKDFAKYIRMVSMEAIPEDHVPECQYCGTKTNEEKCPQCGGSTNE